jgi:hypothetical protein
VILSQQALGRFHGCCALGVAVAVAVAAAAAAAFALHGVSGSRDEDFV